jgi:hypothetical protein
LADQKRRLEIKHWNGTHARSIIRLPKVFFLPSARRDWNQLPKEAVTQPSEDTSQETSVELNYFTAQHSYLSVRFLGSSEEQWYWMILIRQG